MEGDTPGEAIEAVDDALTSVIEVLIEDGEDVPEPLYAREYSGRTQLRLPPTLHARAVMLAQAEGISLNRWLSDAVARAAGACEQST
jgi:predicted HicB family RNase H-like nuclease